MTTLNHICLLFLITYLNTKSIGKITSTSNYGVSYNNRHIELAYICNISQQQIRQYFLSITITKIWDINDKKQLFSPNCVKVSKWFSKNWRHQKCCTYTCCHNKKRSGGVLQIINSLNFTCIAGYRWGALCWANPTVDTWGFAVGLYMRAPG